MPENLLWSSLLLSLQTMDQKILLTLIFLFQNITIGIQSIIHAIIIHLHIMLNVIQANTTNINLQVLIFILTPNIVDYTVTIQYK